MKNMKRSDIFGIQTVRAERTVRSSHRADVRHSTVGSRSTRVFGMGGVAVASSYATRLRMCSARTSLISV